MIAHLSGNLLYKTVESLTVDVGGVGYEVHAPLTTFYALPDEGSTISLLIYTYVKEDAIKLFGFLTPAEKTLFIKLIGVSGVGPKLGLNILSGMDTKDLIRAIKSGDIVRMNAIPGVGKKTAERLILELRDKLVYEPGEEEKALPLTSGEQSIEEDAISALVNLGYKKAEVEKAFAILRREHEDRQWTVEALIKESLKVMSK